MTGGVKLISNAGGNAQPFLPVHYRCRQPLTSVFRGEQTEEGLWARNTPA